MLVFPQWRPDLPGARYSVRQRWMNAERFAPYLARPSVLPPLPPQVEDEDSGGGCSPERERASSCGEEPAEGACGWRGCGARLPSVARLSAHVARHHAHAHADGLFYCGWHTCARPQRGFNARYKMLVHVRTHTNERPHACNQCNKSFSRAENLKIHLRSHSGEKPYICPYEGCGKAYSNSSDRFKHTRTHTIDKPYFCKVSGCNKRYTDPSSLRKHVKTYKHFTSEKDIQRKEFDEDKVKEMLSPPRDINPYMSMEHTSPLHTGINYSPPQSIPSPEMSPYHQIEPLTETPLSPTFNYVPVIDQINYVRPLDPLYPLRVPTHEISYIEYTQMYDHAYRNHYLNSNYYPILRPSVREKIFTYEEKLEESAMEKVLDSPKKLEEEKPLNLICAKRMDCKPITDLVRITDIPLDLSTKT